MSDTNTTYKPGDVANGHILTPAGQWVPMGAPAPIAAGGPTTGGPTPPAGPGVKKPIYQRWWFITAGVLVALMIIGSVSGGEETSASGDQAAASAPADSKAKPEPAEAAKSEPKAAAQPEPAAAPEPEPEPEPEAMAVDAAAMLKEFKGNEAAADLKYRGKTLEVTGTAVKVDTEFFDDESYIIEINGGGVWDILTVNCNDVSAGEAAHVKVNREVTVVGTFDDGGDLGVELKDCAVA
jgi:pyruvate/2-oxoglutarate dehydrogenase complex dihydrolipoamide acyltransferase (E2) component